MERAVRQDAREECDENSSPRDCDLHRIQPDREGFRHVFTSISSDFTPYTPDYDLFYSLSRGADFRRIQRVSW